MNKTARGIFLMLFMATPAMAFQSITVPDNGTATAKISGKEVNRIAVNGGRIKRLFGAEGSLQVEIDDEKGEVYVRPLDTRVVSRDGTRMSAPVNLFITDDQGRTYTLVLEIADIPAETIMINGAGGAIRRGASTSANRVVLGRESSYKETITEAIRSIANNEVPDGFSAQHINEQVPLWKEANFVLKSVYKNDNLVIEKYVLTNTSNTEMRLLESEFRRSGVLAVGLENAVLRNNETSVVYIARELAGE